MLTVGTRVRSTWSPGRIFGEIVGYGLINAYTLDAVGAPIEQNDITHVAYLVRLDKMIVDEKTDDTFRAARVVVMSEEHTEVIF